MRRWMSLRASGAAFMLGAALLATPASAAQYLYTISGAVVLDELSYDELQLFGPTLGPTFSAAFVVDDAVPQAIYSYGATGSGATGGGTAAPGTLPPLSASLTIGGVSYAVRQGNSATGPVIGPDGEPYGASSLERDLGSILKDAGTTRLDLAASYYREAFCCYPVGYEFSAAGDYLDFALTSAAFTDPDYRQLGTFALTSGGGYFNSFVQSGPNPGAMTQIRLTGQTLTVSSLAAVPEVGTWVMMLVGVGLVGWTLRRCDPLPAGTTRPAQEGSSCGQRPTAWVRSRR